MTFHQADAMDLLVVLGNVPNRGDPVTRNPHDLLALDTPGAHRQHFPVGSSIAAQCRSAQGDNFGGFVRTPQPGRSVGTGRQQTGHSRRGVFPDSRIDDGVSVTAQNQLREASSLVRERGLGNIPRAHGVVPAGADQPLGIVRIDQKTTDTGLVPFGRLSNKGTNCQPIFAVSHVATFDRFQIPFLSSREDQQHIAAQLCRQGGHC